jgi:hypothetical protein
MDLPYFFFIPHHFPHMTMDKKTLTIVIVVGVVVLAGAAYGYNRWRQQRMVSQVVNAIYGGQFAGNPLTGGKIPQNVAAEIVKQAAADEAAQKAEDARSAAKTPEDKYNETEEMISIGTVYPAATDVIKPAIGRVFGKTKMTGYSGGYGGALGGFVAMFKVPRVVAAQDMNALAKLFIDDGYVVVTQDADADGVMIMLQKDGVAMITLAFTERGENQEVSVSYSPLESE